MTTVSSQGRWVSVSFLGEMFHDSFKEAFKRIYDDVKKRMDDKSIQYLHLETMWVETPEGKPIDFYTARDMACDMGILINGEMKEMS
jgi:hypothetical protein